MIEFLLFGLFSIVILLWLVSQPTPTRIYDIRFKRMIENDIRGLKNASRNRLSHTETIGCKEM